MAGTPIVRDLFLGHGVITIVFKARNGQANASRSRLCMLLGDNVCFNGRIRTGEIYVPLHVPPRRKANARLALETSTMITATSLSGSRSPMSLAILLNAPDMLVLKAVY